MDAAARKIQTRPSRQEPDNVVVRELGAFVRMVVEAAGSRSLQDAAAALFPQERVAPALSDRLRHMLLVAVATLCDSAGPGPTDDDDDDDDDDTATAAEDIVRSAQCSIAAVQQAASAELAEAHAYFLAPPWRGELAAQQAELADLGFGVARFMIECASECLV
jgi:hypothetical protein